MRDLPQNRSEHVVAVFTGSLQSMGSSGGGGGGSGGGVRGRFSRGGRDSKAPSVFQAGPTIGPGGEGSRRSWADEDVLRGVFVGVALRA